MKVHKNGAKTVIFHAKALIHILTDAPFHNDETDLFFMRTRAFLWAVQLLSTSTVWIDLKMKQTLPAFSNLFDMSHCKMMFNNQNSLCRFLLLTKDSIRLSAKIVSPKNRSNSLFMLCCTMYTQKYCSTVNEMSPSS